VRGSLIAAKEAFIVLGIMAGYAALAIMEAAGVDEASQWRISWATPFPFALAIFTIMSYAPYSPRWLLKKKRVGEARAAMRYLLPEDDESSIDREVSTIQATLQTEAGAGAEVESASSGVCFCCDESEKRQWSLLSTARRPLIVGLMMVALQQVTGQPTVLYYAQARGAAAAQPHGRRTAAVLPPSHAATATATADRHMARAQAYAAVVSRHHVATRRHHVAIMSPSCRHHVAIMSP
jgi:hypothetical protein